MIKAVGTKRTKTKDTDLISESKQKKEQEEEYVFLPFQNPDSFNPNVLKDDKELEDRGIIIIDNYICKETLSRASKRLLILHFNDNFTDEIQIILNSPGGDCDAGWAFIDLMSFVKNNIKTVAMGEICSMATSIFIAGDHRVMSPNCMAMIHQFSEYGHGGKYGDLVAKGKMWQMEHDKDIAHLIKYSKYKTKEQIKKNILKEYDNWLSPSEMKKHGLCDEIYQPTRNTRRK